MTYTLQEVEDPSFLDKEREATRFSSTVDYFGVNIGPYNHPTAIANLILNTIQHTKSFGLQSIAPQGRGKTTLITVIAHHIHLKRPEFEVVWGDSEDFKDIAGFLERQKKYTPLVICFDDISGALKEMNEKDMQANFATLTKIRWIVDPEKGETPVIVLTTGHYSRTTEKSYRAVLGLVALGDFGNEELTNIDLLAPKGTFARIELLRFKKIAESMFSKHEFYLRLGNGAPPIRCETDKPLRPVVVLSGTNGYTIVYSKDDVCELCSKKKTAKFVPPKVVFDAIKKAHGASGVMALKLALYKRGKFLALGKRVAPASDFIEKRLLPKITTDFDGLVEEIYKDGKKKIPSRLYRPLKKEKQIMEDIKNEFEDIEELTEDTK